MDLKILLALQNFREGTGEFLTEFFLKMTFFGEMNVILFVLAAIYWCVSKEAGSFLLMGWNCNRILNGFLKVTFCAYRPWIRNPALVPEASSLKTATGYSFPSGHSTNGASLFGGIAVYSKDRKVKIGAWLMVAMIAFSRIFLCVHTPQDILVGSVLSSFVMWLVLKLMRRLEGNDRAELIAAVLMCFISIALAVYASVKPYPMDYDASGKLLVDGHKMANDTYKAVGLGLAFFLGRLIEKRYICFPECKSREEFAARLIWGAIGFYLVSLLICPAVKNLLGGWLGTVASYFIIMSYITVIFPVFINKFFSESEV